jgi:putative tricarboxylic transport membrane protein
LKKVDIAAALVLIALSAVVVVDTWDLPYWTTFAPGPSFASVWVSAAGALIGTVLLIQALRTRDDQPAGWPDRGGARRVVLCIGALWLFLLILPFLGTVLSGLAFMLIFLLGIVRRPLAPSLFTSVLTVALIEAVFVLWLRIDLPGGVLGF